MLKAAPEELLQQDLLEEHDFVLLHSVLFSPAIARAPINKRTATARVAAILRISKLRFFFGLWGSS
ncbi:hypothetical protein B7486_15580 [cyanobacterium TDX16]|nr:hypothetical protein B7486_15580 [cyanobacterium TDX16]